MRRGGNLNARIARVSAKLQSNVMTQPLRQEKPRNDRPRDRDPARKRRPFDNSEINQLPRVRSDDPPYQNWWVIDARTDSIKL